MAIQFIDSATISVKAGKGGDGCIGFRKEKYIAKGGPDGGDGGSGGCVIFVATSNLNTLIDFSFKRNFEAQNGAPGEKNLKSGKSGNNLEIPVPVGTQVFFHDKVVADLKNDEDIWIAAKGGIGGKGNHFFKSSTNQAPDKAQKGQIGEEFELRLELKSIADIGLVGFPSAGKSTLISCLSAAKPKIGDYPFTTLRPNLGVVNLDTGRSFVMADIPGIIEGAHEGKGLGNQFLRHIERCKALLFVLDPTNTISISEQYQLLLKELVSYKSELAKTPKLISISKQDVKDVFNEESIESSMVFDSEPILFSSQSGEGLETLKTSMWKMVSNYATS